MHLSNRFAFPSAFYHTTVQPALLAAAFSEKLPIEELGSFPHIPRQKDSSSLWEQNVGNQKKKTNT